MSLPLTLSKTSSLMNEPIYTDGLQSSEQLSSVRDPRALDVLYITSTEDFHNDISQNLKKNAEKSNVPMEIIYVEDLRGYNQNQKNTDLKNRLNDLHCNGKIDKNTQIIISVHGSVTDGPHQLSNKKNDFSIDTSEVVSLIRNSKKSSVESVNSDVWDGTIHIGACGVARAGAALKDDSGMNLLYAGKKIKIGIDNESIFSEVIRQLGEYRKDIQKNPFPSVQQFYEAAGSISGEKVNLSGKGNVCHIRSPYLPAPTDLVRQDVVDRLERLLTAKLMHGKSSTVKNIVDLLGSAVQNIKFCHPIIALSNSIDHEIEEKLNVLKNVGFDVNQRFSSDETALHLSVKAGLQQNALFLVKYGADINAKNINGETPLSIAISQGNVEMIEVLIDAGADFSATDLKGNSALHIACEKGRKDLVESLLDKGVSAYALNKSQCSPLQNAISAKHINIAELILKKSPQIDFSGHCNYDQTLYSLLTLGQPQLFRAMINQSPDRQNALADVFSILEEKITENNKIFQSDSGLFSERRIILSNLISLMLESNGSMPDYFKDYLVKSSLGGYQKYLPVVLAVPNLGENWSEDLEELREMFAARGQQEVSNLFGAALKLKSILSEKIDPELHQLYQRNSADLTPFLEACTNGNLAELMILDNRGVALKRSLGPDRKTALMLACEANSVEVVKWLLDKGIDRDLQDANGKTALDYAIEKNNPEIKHEILSRFPFPPVIF